jgi:hypothetical protein
MICKFATQFIEGHPKEGQPTHFVEKIKSGEKIHTIRAGNKWEDGDVMEFRYLDGLDLVEFFPDKEIYWEPIDIEWGPGYVEIFIHGEERNDIFKIARNSGLKWQDFKDWFTDGVEEGTFSGQILHWTDFKYKPL